MTAFIDFQKAYDRVDRQKLCSCLWQNGVRGNFLNLLKALYLNSKCQVKVVDEVSVEFAVTVDLRQGCVLSLLLFSLYINSLVVELKRSACGVRCGTSTIPGLLYPDDTSLFANDAASLKRGLSVLEKWCTEWGVKINTKKSGIVHFKKRGVKRVSCEFPVQGEYPHCSLI